MMKNGLKMARAVSPGYCRQGSPGWFNGSNF